MTDIDTQKQFIELFKDLVIKAAFPSDIQAAVSSINETLEDEDAIHALKANIQRYDKEAAMHHIIFLMRDFNITSKEIQDFTRQYQTS